jgi:hypothetical protein
VAAPAVGAPALLPASMVGAAMPASSSVACVYRPS